MPRFLLLVAASLPAGAMAAVNRNSLARTPPMVSRGVSYIRCVE